MFLFYCLIWWEALERSSGLITTLKPSPLHAIEVQHKTTRR
jgi:hypothetical protein